MKKIDKKIFDNQSIRMEHSGCCVPVRNIVFNEDCLKILNKLSDQEFDLAVVDPPYGIGQYWKKSTKSKYYQHHSTWNNIIPSGEYFDELFRVSKNQIIWGGNYFTKYLPPTNAWIFWDKGRTIEKEHMSEGELAWTSFKVPMRKLFVQWSGARKGVETGMKTIHPCQRPVALYEWIYKHYKASSVLDTHVGSGSNRIAAYSAGVDFVGVEIDREYWELQEKRFFDFKAQLTIPFSMAHNVQV